MRAARRVKSLSADSDDPGRLFQSDPGHHFDLIPAGQKPDRVA
jgi:hypothetical protein